VGAKLGKRHSRGLGLFKWCNGHEVGGFALNALLPTLCLVIHAEAISATLFTPRNHPCLEKRLAREIANQITWKEEEVGLDTVLHLRETEELCCTGGHFKFLWCDDGWRGK
jgi:hypothetical protein